MANKFPNPSTFESSVQNLSFSLMHLSGRQPRNQATIQGTIPQSVTMAIGLVPDRGRITSFRMKALESGTTSSATFNTIALYKIPVGSVTASALATLRTNRGLNGGEAVAAISGATALVNPGDMLFVRKLTKLNTNSQLIASVLVDREVT